MQFDFVKKSLNSFATIQIFKSCNWLMVNGRCFSKFKRSLNLSGIILMLSQLLAQPLLRAFQFTGTLMISLTISKRVKVTFEELLKDIQDAAEAGIQKMNKF